MEVKQLFDILRKEAECSFCIYPFNKPKILPCLHSFCLDCLNKYAATRRRQGHTTFDCPECLATFRLPNDDKFDGFQTAFHKNRLLDILALEKTSTGQQKNCDNCDENVAASSYCFECQASLCEACLDKHNAIKITKAHRQASLQNLQATDVEALIQRPVLCDKQYHEREPLEYYCEDCRVCICHKCEVVEHKKHSIHEIPRVAEQHKRQIIQDVEQMKSRVSECKEKIEKSKKNFEGVEQQVEEARQKIKARVEELIRGLKKHEANIMRELDEAHQTQQQAHLVELKSFELSLAQLNSAIEFAEAIMRRNMGPEIVQTKEAITQRCVGLVTDQKITPHKSVRVSLVTNDEFCQTVCQSALGRVVVSLTDPSRSLAVGKGLQEAECGERAEFAVVTKDAEGQQCYDKRDQVTIHVQTVTQEVLEVKIDDEKNGTYHVTYVPQRHGQHHLITNVNGQPLTGSPWNVHVNQHQYEAIWLTEPSRSLAEGKGLQEAKCGERAEFTVITKDARGQQCYYKRDQVTVHIQTAGQEELEVKIEDKKDGTYHVAYVPQRHRQHHVMINVNGKPLTGPWSVYMNPHQYQSISSFGSKGTGKGQFNGPSGISVSSTGNFAVADYPNNRIQVFTSEGAYLREFGQKRLKEPLSVAYTSPDHIIVVGDTDDGERKALMYTESGTFLKQFSPVHLKRPWSVSVTNDGRVIVCDLAGDKDVKVLSYDGEKLLLSFSAPSCSAFPYDVVYHKEKFFVSYWKKNCIKVFDVKGTYLLDIGGKGTGDAQLQGPRDVAIDKFGDLLVVDSDNDRLQVFTTEGEFLSTSGERGEGLGQFKSPESVAVSTDGQVYVTDSENNRVQILM